MFYKEDEKSRIVDNLIDYLRQYPEESVDFINVIMESLKRYKEVVLQDRNIKYQNALASILGFVLDSKKYKKMRKDKIPYMIDALFYLFPKGKADGYSIIEKDFLKEFVSVCKEFDILNDKSWLNWLISIKGSEYYDWFKLILK